MEIYFAIGLGMVAAAVLVGVGLAALEYSSELDDQDEMQKPENWGK